MLELSKFLRDDSGATSIEYALIAGIIALGIIVGLTNVRSSLTAFFTSAGSEVTAAASAN